MRTIGFCILLVLLGIFVCSGVVLQIEPSSPSVQVSLDNSDEGQACDSEETFFA